MLVARSPRSLPQPGVSLARPSWPTPSRPERESEGLPVLMRVTCSSESVSGYVIERVRAEGGRGRGSGSTAEIAAFKADNLGLGTNHHDRARRPACTRRRAADGRRLGQDDHNRHSSGISSAPTIQSTSRPVRLLHHHQAYPTPPASWPESESPQPGRSGMSPSHLSGSDQPLTRSRTNLFLSYRDSSATRTRPAHHSIYVDDGDAMGGESSGLLQGADGDGGGTSTGRAALPPRWVDIAEQVDQIIVKAKPKSKSDVVES